MAVLTIAAKKTDHEQYKSLPYPPPPAKARALVVWHGLTDRFVCCCHERIHTLLFRKQFVPCCTTKYIFWLGKNKFDRGGPSLIGGASSFFFINYYHFQLNFSNDEKLKINQFVSECIKSNQRW